MCSSDLQFHYYMVVFVFILLFLMMIPLVRMNGLDKDIGPWVVSEDVKEPEDR